MIKDGNILVTCCKNALELCLQVTKQDKVVIVYDKSTEEIVEAFSKLLTADLISYETFDLDTFGNRPLATLPAPISKSLQQCSVSIFLAQKVPGELNLRLNLLSYVKQYGIRHSHMPGIDKEMFIRGLNVDYRVVSKLQDILLSLLKDGSIIKVYSPYGTDLEVEISNKYRWIKADGIIQPGIWQNIPSGQLFTVPDKVNGIFVADGSIGEWFSIKYTDLSSNPLKVEIKDNRIISVESSNRSLASKFLLYIHSNQDGDRIGEFSFGTNIYLKEFIGNGLHDENIPGVHIAAGDPLGYLTGAKWTAKTRVSLIGKELTVFIDNTKVIENGEYVDSIINKLQKGGIS